MRPLLVAASVWPAAPPRHHVVVATVSPCSDSSSSIGGDVAGGSGGGQGVDTSDDVRRPAQQQSLWTGADDGGIVRWVLKGRDDDGDCGDDADSGLSLCNAAHPISDGRDGDANTATPERRRELRASSHAAGDGTLNLKPQTLDRKPLNPVSLNSKPYNVNPDP
jgi:hypothetical protein